MSACGAVAGRRLISSAPSRCVCAHSLALRFYSAMVEIPVVNYPAKMSAPDEASAITLRPASAADEDFLRAVYASTRAEEMLAAGWDAAQQEAFLSLQFKARQMIYQLEYGQACAKIILLEGEPVGSLMVARKEREIRLADIALLSEYRSRGIGAALIKDLCAEAAQTGKPVSLHVLKTSAAIRLYERLGFKTTGERGMHLRMEWIP